MGRQMMFMEEITSMDNLEGMAGAYSVRHSSRETGFPGCQGALVRETMMNEKPGRKIPKEQLEEAVKLWRELGIRKTPEEIQAHWEKIYDWENEIGEAKKEKDE